MNVIDKEELVNREKKYAIDTKNLKKIAEMNESLPYKYTELEDKYANIFIIGLQRSGTTLLNQLLAKYSNLGYINNLTARFWENPKYGIALSKDLNLFERNKIILNSNHGKTNEIENVHEFGYFWASLLGHKSSPNLNERSPNQINWRLLKNKVLSINYAFNSNTVFKNTLIGHYASYFNELFKFPFFIYIKRNHLDTAVSILKTREERYGNKKMWWSMKPKEYEKIKNLDPYEQIAAQIFYLEKDIKNQIKGIDNNNIIIINYEDLCKKASNVFIEIQKKLKFHDFKFEFSTNIEEINNNREYQRDEITRNFEKALHKYYPEI